MIPKTLSIKQAFEVTINLFKELQRKYECLEQDCKAKESNKQRVYRMYDELKLENENLKRELEGLKNAICDLHSRVASPNRDVPN